MNTKALFCFSLLAALASAQPVPPAPPPAPEAPPPPFAHYDMDSRRLLQPSHPKLLQNLDHSFQFQFQNKGRAEDQADRQYERGMRSLDKRQWDDAMAQFEEAAASGKGRADGALYWKAYALMKLGRGKDATGALDNLAKQHPQSRWLNDAKAMRVEIAQAGGRPMSPEDASDDEIKVMAINSLMHSDPERSIPLLEKIIVDKTSPRLRERALFVLSQSESPKAREVVARVAKGGSNPDLQMMAVRSLGVYGGKENRQTLADVYAASTDIPVKKQVLNSYMMAGERDRLLAVAKADPAPELRLSAIRYLGNLGANAELAALYGSETSVEVRSQIMQAMFVGGNTAKLIEIAKSEKDPALRERAVRHLGTMNSPEASAALVAVYTSNADVDLRKKILSALFVQGNAKQLVEVARKETNADLRRAAVQHLSHMQSKEATDFLMELLNK